MTIELHQDCRLALHTQLVKVLKQASRKYGAGLHLEPLDSLIALDEILPDKGKTRQAINIAMGEEYPFFTFVLSYLLEMIAKTGSFDKHEVLEDLFESEEEYDECADDIITEFCGLPWKYTYTYKMPYLLQSVFNFDEDEIVLSDNLKLIRLKAIGFEDNYPLLHPNKNENYRIFGPDIVGEYSEGRKWGQPNDIMLQFKVDGFLADRGESNVKSNADGLLRAFFGTCLALRLLQYNSSKVYYYSPQVMIAHKFNGVLWELKARHLLDPYHSDALQHLEEDDLGMDMDDNNRKQNFERVVRGIVHALKPENKKMLLAAQWLFDSYANKSNLLSFIQATTAIEILLGDKESNEEIGLSELLRNRCAYLIGTTRNQRDQLLADFKKIYKVRSQIVHTGKDKLSIAETDMLNQLRWICGRVIQEEISLIEGRV